MNTHPLLRQAEQALKASQLQAAETTARSLLANRAGHLGSMYNGFVGPPVSQ